jgi:murein DD-endopeptidase MepM/ murein hydrolase activator NlpD
MFPQLKHIRDLNNRRTWRRWIFGWRNLPTLAVIFIMGYQASEGYSGVFARERVNERSRYSIFSTSVDIPSPRIAAQEGSWIYYTQSGDTLRTVAARFKIRPQDIQIQHPDGEDQLLDPGQVLVIPRPEQRFEIFKQILLDYEVVYSPNVIGFDTQDYVSRAGGYLSTHQEYMRSTGLTSGAEIVERVAVENSVHPRLLLAILEYKCGCVLGSLADGVDPNYLMGVNEPFRKGLYRQLGWVVNQLSLGYYSWRQGLLSDLVFNDASIAKLAPDLNAGSASIAYLFSRMYDRGDWNQAMDPRNGFKRLHRDMYSDIQIDNRFDAPIFPPGLAQPDLNLPFQQGREWGYTSGPHKAWETEGALAALDFAPATERFGCERSNAWVVAVADGLVVRSEHGAVVLDLDGDGFEGTGWAVLYMHLENRHRVEEGTYLHRGDKIGHPSCEGGPANGTHVHIARKYNGEWIAADGPLPFVMSGWVAKAGYRPFEGSLFRGDQVVVANALSPAQAFISLTADDLKLNAEVSRDLWWEE